MLNCFETGKFRFRCLQVRYAFRAQYFDGKSYITKQLGKNVEIIFYFYSSL